MGMGLIQEAFAVPSEEPDPGTHVEKPYTENLVDEPGDDRPEQPGFYTGGGDPGDARERAAPATGPVRVRPAPRSPNSQATTVLVGVLSDTHGKLDPAIVELFAGCDHIVHAGDVEDRAILERLTALAPVTAVHGNDVEGTCAGLPECATVVFDGFSLHVRHDLVMIEALDASVLAAMHDAGCGVVVSGHTHVPDISRKDGIVYLNPGSASVPRGGLARSVALLRIEGGECTATIHELGRDALS